MRSAQVLRSDLRRPWRATKRAWACRIQLTPRWKANSAKKSPRILLSSTMTNLFISSRTSREMQCHHLLWAMLQAWVRNENYQMLSKTMVPLLLIEDWQTLKVSLDWTSWGQIASHRPLTQIKLARLMIRSPYSRVNVVWTRVKYLKRSMSVSPQALGKGTIVVGSKKGRWMKISRLTRSLVKGRRKQVIE